MKKLLLIFLLVTACSDYIVDPRASKEPKEILRDKSECEMLIYENTNLVVRFVDKDRLMKKITRVALKL